MELLLLRSPLHKNKTPPGDKSTSLIFLEVISLFISASFTSCEEALPKTLG